MAKGKWDARTYIAAAVLLATALASVFFVARIASSPEFHAASIAALDEKKVTVMELTAVTAASSIAVSAVPGDSTTPIANQIAELSTYLLIVVGAIMLEKFLLTMSCYAAFHFLIPAACALGVVYLFTRRGWFKALALRLALFGAVICVIVPVSIGVSGLIDQTFQMQQMVEDADQTDEQLDAAAQAAEENNGNWLAQIGQGITNGVSDVVKQAEAALSRLVDVIAALVITTCVIPIAVLLFFLWVTKIIFGIEGRLPIDRAAGPARRTYRKTPLRSLHGKPDDDAR